MTVQSVGAALSPALGGVLAHRFGYSPAFLVLGAVSTGSIVLWLGFGKSLRHACSVPEAEPTQTHEPPKRGVDPLTRTT